MKDFDTNKESSYLMYWDVNHRYRWAMPQKWPVDSFQSRKDSFRFNEKSMQNCDEGRT